MTAGEARDYVAGAISRRFHRWEIGVDGAIHAAAIIAGLIGAVALLLIASRRGDALDVAAVAIYSAGLVAMFGCSAAYNLGRFTRHGNWLRSLDNSAIFLMIGGTYTPFTVLDLNGAWSWSLTSIVWTVAIAGVLLRLFHARLFDRVSLLLYLALGWIGVVALPPLVQALDMPALVLLFVGGALYTIGLIFHLWHRLPFQNAIWHGFVVAAAATHFAAIVISLAAPAGPT
jgi:hemolysin III